MSLRELNWTGLGSYNVQPTDMSDFQTACFDQIRVFLSQKRSTGVLVGCDVNPNTGLDVKIKAGLLLLANGKLGFLEVDTVLPLTAADATNPRIDRIEADFTTTNERSGLNELGSTVVITKLHGVTLSVVTGTPGATPSAPARTSGKVSLGTILVPSGSTLVSSANIESSHKSRDFSSEKPNYIIQNPSNNQTAAAPLKDMILDKTKHKLVVYEGDLYRSDSTQGKTALVKLICSYNIFSDQWVFVAQLEGEDTGITFQFDQSKQQVTYKSTNYGGSGHAATLTLRTQVTER